MCEDVQKLAVIHESEELLGVHLTLIFFSKQTNHIRIAILQSMDAD